MRDSNIRIQKLQPDIGDLQHGAIDVLGGKTRIMRHYRADMLVSTSLVSVLFRRFGSAVMSLYKKLLIISSR